MCAAMLRSFLVLAVCVGIAAGAASAETRSGLRGTVMRGPTSPVCRADDPCDEPAANVTLLFSRNGEIVARATTTDAGRYRIALAPAAYAVRVRGVSKVARIDPARVRVFAGVVRRVDFDIDTGIR